MIYLRYIKYGLIVLVLLAAFVLMPIFYNKWRDAEARADQISNYAISKTRETEYLQNALGQQVAKTQAVELDRKAFNDLREDFQYLQQEFVGVKKNLRNVEQITKLNVSVKDTLYVANRDTIINNQSVVAFSYQDEWEYIEGLVFPDTTILRKQTEVPIEIVVLWERKKWLGLKVGKKQYNVQAVSENQDAVISGLQNITIRKR